MIETRYSTFWPRFWAGFIDSLIFAPVGWLLSSLYSAVDSITLRVLIYTLNTCLFTAYSIWMHGTRGQTLGKMSCDVIVVDVSERPLGLKQAALRDIPSLIMISVSMAIDIPRILGGINVFSSEATGALASLAIYSGLVLFLVEIVTMLTNSKRRALHDLIAGSVVVRVPGTYRAPDPIAGP